ncbi:Ku protein, partial [Rhizobium johnstonii]|uniref:Ku protein n=1 Tax=Rhizobium johnstonii TaxID=3019933 RepID=UPI003F9B5950
LAAAFVANAAAVLVVHLVKRHVMALRRRCEVCGKIIPYQHIDKAFDDGDRTVVLTNDDIESLPAERSREIEVVEFVPNE